MKEYTPVSHSGFQLEVFTTLAICSESDHEEAAVHEFHVTTDLLTWPSSLNLWIHFHRIQGNSLNILLFWRNQCWCFQKLLSDRGFERGLLVMKDCSINYTRHPLSPFLWGRDNISIKNNILVIFTKGYFFPEKTLLISKQSPTP